MTIPGSAFRPILFSSKQAEDDLIPLESLSDLVGFPVEQLKEELEFEGDEISLESLRESVLKFLDLTMEEFKKAD
ncbi:MAG: hypothetical protein DRQ88_04985 [Epsilonproteobacteria bacterium]|nr:MAG: hypothetical protein DRQ89_10780 [Campylobacterota bacterium]RLA66889.1 MAG: hypothetical protein DRQ88_04985 [Campylobacterota bacterium]